MNSAHNHLPDFELLEPRLLMDASPLLGAEDDYGDTRDTAHVVALDAEKDAGITGVINESGEQDIFEFTADFDGTMTAAVAADAGSGLDTMLYAYDGPASVIAWNDDFGGTTDSQITFSVTEGQTYWLRVRGSNDGVGSYAVALNGQATVDDYGDTRGSSTAVVLDGSSDADLAGVIETSDDQDLFRITTAEDTRMTITMAADDSALDSVLYIYDGPGSVLTANDDAVGSDAQVAFTAQAGQTYWIRATNDEGTIGAYTLQFRGVADDYGDTRGTAELVTLDGSFDAALAGEIEIASDQDIFEFTATFKGTMTVDLAAAAGSTLDTNLYIYDGPGSIVTRNDDAGGTDSQVTFSVTNGQTYWVRATNSVDSTGTYNLTLNGQEFVDDYGDTRGTAELFALDGNDDADLTGSIGFSGEQDLFEFVAPGNGVMTVTLSAAAGSTLDTDLRIYDGPGSIVASNDNASGTDSQVTFALVSGKTYWIRAKAADDSVGTYEMAVRGVTDDYGNTRDSSEPVALDVNDDATVNGRIEMSSDQDIFAIVPDFDGTMTVNLSAAAGSTLDTNVYVYDGPGSIIALNDDYGGGSDSQVTFTVSSGQTYWVRATNSNDSTGAYVLSFNGLEVADDYGDTRDTAHTVTLDGSHAASIDGSIELGGDQDLFGFVADYTGQMTVDIDALTDMDPVAYVYDADGNVLTWNDDYDGLNSRVQFNVQSGQQYYIRARDYSTGTGDYRVTFRGAESIPTPTEEAGTVRGSVLATLVESGGSTHLYVEGTDGNDTITISRSGGSYTIVSQNGTQTIAASADAVAVYGFGGDDTLRLDYSVQAYAYVFAGDGNDTVYSNSQGSSEVFGGVGDDLLITIGGGADSAFGQSGSDSLWVDAGRDTHDASAAEWSAKMVHEVSEFYQPWTTDRNDDDYIWLAVDGSDLRDPALAGYASYYADFSDRVLINGLSYDDADQGALGDCYYLAGLASLAETDPGVIRQAITALGDGTYAVRYFDGNQEVYLRIDGDLPVRSSGSMAYQGLGNGGDTWMALMEKAYAFYRYGENSYSSIEGGWMGTVYAQITGESTGYMSVGSYTETGLYNTLVNHRNAGHAVTLGSWGTQPSGSRIVGSHAYVVQEVGTDGGERYVTVYNPWGWDGIGSDNDVYDGLIRLTLRQVRQYFSSGAVSYA
ncbi:MAG: C2 family cysteine protease [Phycisphaerae bacterium]